MSSETNTRPLVRTKLRRPRLAGNLVPRPRLLACLEQRRERVVTLVSSPAGSGKTTLLSDRLDRSDGPAAWLSLDERDNEFARF